MSINLENKKTPLYTSHLSANAKIVDFGGWKMPIHYEGTLKEHKYVRDHCGVFDVSHMGEIRVTGKDAKKALQFLTFNDIDKLHSGQGQYTGFCNNNGGMIDDVILYQIADDDFFICVNASNQEIDDTWIRKNSSEFSIQIHNESSIWSQIAVQGPKSREVLTPILGTSSPLNTMNYMSIAPIHYEEESGYLARTGYTGELGYEIYLKGDTAIKKLWQDLLATNTCLPIGLGARDTLRLEASYLLYGNDMNQNVTPVEAGISWAVRLEVPQFIGRDALVRQKKLGPEKKLIAFLMEEKAIPRHEMKVIANDKVIGHVTSGSYLPTLEKAGGFAYIDTHFAKIDQELRIDIRGKRKLAKIVKKPLYSSRVN